ncbi:MAG: lysophospholipid acyltransferase family protein [Phycisphaerales bacterium]|nr:lysophospholipid acyltransferase family protein [Phycisphaerales bacterium]
MKHTDRTNPDDAATEFVPGRFNRRVFRVMSVIARRSIRRKFHGTWMAPGGCALLAEINAIEGPVICGMNHSAWWDPMVGLLLHSGFMPDRTPCSPMDSVQLAKFGIFRRAGVFGINPDDPDSLGRMESWVRERFTKDRRSVLWVTPQGEFTDPREPFRPRPGMASIAAAHPGARVFGLAVEYPFWLDSRPEICMRLVEIPAPHATTTTGWQREIKTQMQANGDALARIVRQRDHEGLEPVLNAGKASIHPVYNLWLRLRGKSAGIDVDHRSETTT